MSDRHDDESPSQSDDSVDTDATLQDYGPPASLTAERESAAPPPSDVDAPETAQMTEEAKKPGSPIKKIVMTALKIGVSVGGLYLVYGRAIGREGLALLGERLETLSWGWFAAAMAMQCTAIAFAIFRWRVLLGGQGIHARWGFLAPSFMIGRFWGAFTPGGLGLDGWRLYDVAKHSGKPARAVTVTIFEKILGQLAFGLVVMGGSLWGLQMIGTSGVLMINAFFVVLVTVGVTFLAKPRWFLPLFRLLPAQVQPRLGTMVDAVTAYHGKFKILTITVLCGVAVHAFNNLIYVCAAQAMHLELSPMTVFFASSLVILSTILPLSLNGVGLREATAAGVLSAFGVAAPIAAATYTLGWVAEMCVSAIGVPIYLARRASYDAKLVVDDADREDKVIAAATGTAPEDWPKPLRGLSLGAGAGLLAGLLIGLGEGGVIVADGGGRAGYGVLAYGAIAYGVFCACGGAAMGLSLAWLGRLMKREAVPEAQAFAMSCAAIVAPIAFALAVFRIRRDVFHEELVLKSPTGLLVVGGCFLGAAALFTVLMFALRRLTASRAGAFLLRPWGTPAFAGLVVAAVAGAAIAIGEPPAQVAASSVQAPADAPNVLLIVVDTLRADHLPAYGYERGSTPALDRFAEDAVRYDAAFANASWTRPSFASILTGRYPSSHGVMAKPEALSDEVDTLAESLQGAGWATRGWVTNFNVGPYFNFQQGFDGYTFLEPEFVLGADDSAAKLLLVQALRQTIEKVRAARGTVEAGAAYQDAETVNRHVVRWLDGETASDAAPSDRPWFAFVGYMDPHDPYFPHPYDGTGYSRAAHQHPDLAEAAGLRELYDGEITYWDEQFGALMDELRRRGEYDNTLIVVTADHGEEFGEHGGFWHGTTLYDEQVHVPLFVKLPGNERAGTHVSHWVQSVDLMPTVLARLGVESPAGVQGGSLEEGTTRVYAEESHEGNVLESVRELRDFEELKLITANPGNPRGLETAELYLVGDDPGETDNRAPEEPTRVQALMRAMDEARERAAEGAVEGQEVEMDETSRRQLCQIGYIDAEICCEQGLLSGEQCRGTRGT